jgi:hypothetical protein
LIGNDWSSSKVFSVTTISDAIFNEHYKKWVKLDELSTPPFCCLKWRQFIKPIVSERLLRAPRYSFFFISILFE